MAPCSLLVVLCLACLLADPAAPAPAPAALPRRGADISSACRCTREFNAVCANDGQTYSNKCMLNCARAMGASRMGQELQMMRMGPC